MTADVPLAGAFLAGLVSFLSPCVLPLVPGYISMLSGIGMEQLRQGEAPSSGLFASARPYRWRFDPSLWPASHWRSDQVESPSWNYSRPHPRRSGNRRLFSPRAALWRLGCGSFFFAFSGGFFRPIDGPLA